MELRGIHDRDVLRVMGVTPRHLFVPPHLRSRAYENCPLPIGYGATISQPYMVALMTELLRLNLRHRVLEIGTGSGYQAAVLAQLSACVYSLEMVPELAHSARATLEDLGYRNVIVRQGDGYLGWPEEAPFDRIILTAAPVEIPAVLIDQLSPKGRLVAPVGTDPHQELILVAKSADGTIRRHRESFVAFVPMRPSIY